MASDVTRGQIPKPIQPGARFGLVTFVRFAKSLGNGARCVVRCDCGIERIVHAGNLRKMPRTHRSCEPYRVRGADERSGRPR